MTAQQTAEKYDYWKVVSPDYTMFCETKEDAQECATIEREVHTGVYVRKVRMTEEEYNSMDELF